VTTCTDPAILKMCLHKRAYLTRAKAKQAARKTKRMRGNRKHWAGEYHCPQCGFYHVTSSKPRRL
jgi:rubrerythrin